MIARRFVEGKIQNQRTMLRRNHGGAPQQALEEMARLADLAAAGAPVEALVGIEGAAAQQYFANFAGMLKDKAAAFDFQQRNRRPPTDPVNALLSYLYAVLSKDLTVTLTAIGLDPYLGFLHQPRYGRPALALDVMEEFRPIVCDSAAISMLNTEEIREDHFVRRAGAVGLTPEARKVVLGAHERRIDSLVTHPMFGYTISYRRVLEVQARLLSRHISGEIPDYLPFTTR
jgi:CRISPR-associated protein Cas1